MKYALLLILLIGSLNAAIPAGAVWLCASGSTASNVNGGFFNPGNTSFPTDGTVDSNTGNTTAPVFSSASYNFVAGDVGHWLYIKSGTNTYPGWYVIASVAANKATLTGTIGAAVLHNSTARTYTVSTAAGIASVGTPSSITWGIDYSQGTAALNAITDLVIVASPTTDVTSAGLPFGINHIGNSLHINSGSGFTADWYEIVSVTGSTATLDKPAGTGSSTAGVAKLGGAMSLNSTLDDDLFEKGIAGNDFFAKGALTLGETVTIATATGGTQNPIRIIGMNALRGDAPVGSTRPTITATAAITITTNWNLNNLIITNSVAGSAVVPGVNTRMSNTKIINTSTTANATAIGATLADLYLSNVEAISYRGRAMSTTSSAFCHGCYFHDSDIGVLLSGSGSSVTFVHSIIADNVTAAISTSAAVGSNNQFVNCTLIGSLQTARGTGVNLQTGVTDIRISDTIIAGFVNGVTHADAQSVGVDYYNAYYGNTNDVNTNGNWRVSSTSTTGTNPSFTALTYATGTGATSATTTLTAVGAFTGLTIADNVDFVTFTSATTATTGKYLITSHTDNTLVLSPSPGTGTSIAWEVSMGHNFAIGTALKALGAPGAFAGGLTTGYLDPGAAQRQEAGGGGSGMRIY